MVRKGSLYTSRGKVKVLGSIPSVKSKARAPISRRGASSLGFWTRIGEVEGYGPHNGELIG